MNRRILKLALPSIVSNITVPLLGLMDIAIVGHLGSTAYIGAIAVAGTLFSMLYWGFGFLRMGTGGMTAQAYGRRDMKDMAMQFFRALTVGTGISLLLISLQWPMEAFAFLFIKAGEEVRYWASVYFRICIWGAPAVLGLYVLTGWFIGMQNSRFPMFVAITQNVVNIILSLFFVYICRWGVSGVALGTLMAQWCGLLLGLCLWYRYYGRLRLLLTWKEVFRIQEMKRFFSVNRDIFGRTLCLIAVTTFFTAAGSRQGDVALAVNTLMMQLFTLFSYIMDGFAYAGEALSGRYLGARDRKGLDASVRLVFRWGILLAMLFTILYGIGGTAFLSLLTDDRQVLVASEEYFYWVLCIPFCGFAAFLWDGILIGLTATRQMLLTMVLASATFFLMYYLLSNYWGNHALWIAFLSYLLLRSLGQWAYYRKANYW